MTSSRRPCPCCGFLTLENEPPGTYDICPVCFWEDDPLQFDDAECAGGANGVSLTEARHNFTQFGASKKRVRGNVRPPSPDEHA